MFFLGIDPGRNGGFAIIDSDNHTVIEAMKFDKDSFLSWTDYLSRADKKTKCCLEKVHAMPKQGSVSMFHFGESYGWLKGVLDAFEISYQEIRPQIWKKEFGLTSDKQRSIEVCKQLFPAINLIPAGCKKEQDGIAESLLMAEFARRKL